jgi:phosphoribosylformylglycinamidine synthase subunit PurS
MFVARVQVTIKEEVLDPQGKAVEGALHSLGFTEASGVRIGKFLELNVDAENRETAAGRVREMCERLLSNPVIEDYSFELIER